MMQDLPRHQAGQRIIAERLITRQGPSQDEDYTRPCGGFVIASAEWNSLGRTTRGSLHAMRFTDLCRAVGLRRG